MCRGCASGKATGTILTAHFLEEVAPMNLDTRLATLERQQARIQARHDIWHTIARYARGIDEQRDDDLAEILTDDVVLQTQPWTQRPLVGKAIALKALRIIAGPFSTHGISSRTISLPSTT